MTEEITYYRGVPIRIADTIIDAETNVGDASQLAWRPRMKRMSIAEQTLKKQIEHVYIKWRALNHEIEMLKKQGEIYNNMILDLETEQSRLRAARTTASERVNP